MRSSILFLTVIATTSVAAADREFDAAVRHVESNFEGRRVWIPFLGVAEFVCAIARPAGVKHFKLAVFESLRALSDELPDFTSLGSDWRPLVRVRNRRSRESTAIYAKEQGDWTKIVLLTTERRDATVISMTMRPSQLIDFVENLRGLRRVRADVPQSN